MKNYWKYLIIGMFMGAIITLGGILLITTINKYTIIEKSVLNSLRENRNECLKLVEDLKIYYNLYLVQEKLKETKQPK